MRILILDDDPSLLSALRDLLTAYSHEVDCCDNAKAAVEMASRTAYHVVFVDYKMPDNDGIWFMSNARLPPKTKAILMTAYINREVINRMFALGASGYLIKPFDEDELLRHLDFYTAASQKRPAPPAATMP